MKIIGKLSTARLVRVESARGRVALIDRRQVSREYPLKTLIQQHEWQDDDGSVTLREIREYRGWER